MARRLWVGWMVGVVGWFACHRVPPPVVSPPELTSLWRSPVIRIGLIETDRSLTLGCPTGCRLVQDGIPILERPFDTTVRVLPVYGRIPATSSRRSYWIQVGAFRDRHRAEAFRRNLQRRWRDHRVVVLAAPGYWRVRIGPWRSEAEARDFLRNLQAWGIDGWVVAPSYAVQVERFQVVTDAGIVRTVSARVPLTLIPYGGVLTWEGRSYPGRFHVLSGEDGKLVLVNELPLEVYLVGVVAAELTPRRYPALEALKAQAVAARTYALHNWGQYRSKGYDLCATQACQVYRGVPSPREVPLAYVAVETTRGEIVTYRGEPIQAFYTSTCGGHTESARWIFPRYAAPYLRGVPCIGESSLQSVLVDGAPIPSVFATPPLARTLVQWVHDSRWPVTSSDPRVWRVLLNEGLFTDLPTIASRRAWLIRLGKSAQGHPWDTLLLSEDRTVLDRLAGTFPEDVHPAFRRGLLWLLLFDPALVARWLAPAPAWDSPVQPEEELRLMLRWIATRNPPDVSVRTGTITGIVAGWLRIRTPEGQEKWFRWHPGTVVVQRWGTTWMGGSALLGFGDRVRFVDHGDHIDYLENRHPTAWAGSADRNSPFAWWVIELDAQTLQRRLRDACPTWSGVPTDVVIMQKTPQGRIVHLRFRRAHEEVCDLQGLRIRTVLGLRELRFRFILVRAPDGSIQRVLFVGRGWGHGVGLCQTGAYGMALDGADYRTILLHYYPGTRIDDWFRLPVAARIRTNGS